MAMRETLERVEEARDVMEFARLRSWVNSIHGDVKSLVEYLGHGHGYTGKPGKAYDRLMKAGDSVDGAAKELRAAMQALEDALE